jgi:hypothetical protein
MGAVGKMGVYEAQDGVKASRQKTDVLVARQQSINCHNQ